MFLVDANVLSEATKPAPDPRVLKWLARHEREIAVDPIILGEIRFGILLRVWKVGSRPGSNAFIAWLGKRPRDCAGLSFSPSCAPAAKPCQSRTA